MIYIFQICCYLPSWICTSFLGGVQNIVMSIVCLFVCLFVHSHNSKTARPNFTKYLCMLPLSVAEFCIDGIAICYVLPVLWMTSAESSTSLCLEQVCQAVTSDNLSVYLSSLECGTAGQSLVSMIELLVRCCVWMSDDVEEQEIGLMNDQTVIATNSATAATADPGTPNIRCNTSAGIGPEYPQCYIRHLLERNIRHSSP